MVGSPPMVVDLHSHRILHRDVRSIIDHKEDQMEIYDSCPAYHVVSEMGSTTEEATSAYDETIRNLRENEEAAINEAVHSLHRLAIDNLVINSSPSSIIACIGMAVLGATC